MKKNVRSGATSKRNKVAKNVANGNRTLVGASGFSLKIPSALANKLIKAAIADGYTSSKTTLTKFAITHLRDAVA